MQSIIKKYKMFSSVKNLRTWLEGKSDACAGQEDSERGKKRNSKVTTTAILMNLVSVGDIHITTVPEMVSIQNIMICSGPDRVLT